MQWDRDLAPDLATIMPRSLILGHRGAPNAAPENTLRAFQMALEQGADGVELDVQASSDGVPVVIHDPTLDRTTSGHGRVDSHSWADLQSIRVGAKYPLSRLQDVAEWAAGSGAFLNVELKARGITGAVVETLREHGLLGCTLLSSFESDLVREVGRLAPQVQRFLLSEDWSPAILKEIERGGAEGLCLRDDAATPAALQEISRCGIPLVVWTVDEPARMRTLLEMGLFALITNRPAMAVAVRSEMLGT